MIIYNNKEVEILEEKIWVIHNFVKQEESDIYLEIANSVDEQEWWKENGGWYKGKYLNVANHPIIKELSSDIIQRFSKLFKDGQNYHFGSPGSIHRMKKGQEMYVHADFSETDNSDTDIVLFNTAIYHNDVEGGNIYYPEIGIKYHPTQGDIVIHPGTTRYRHGVTPVLKDTRYISTLWVANDLGMKIKTSGSMM
jgi:hypothetical protein